MRPASGKQLCRALEQAGWRLVRVRGSHHRYERPGFPPVTVPVHGTRVLKPRTQLSIMKAAGLSDGDL